MNIRIVTNALQSYSTRSPYVQPPSDNTSQSKYVLEHILPPSDDAPGRFAELMGFPCFLCPLVWPLRA
jgi:hypothetical protein